MDKNNIYKKQVWSSQRNRPIPPYNLRLLTGYKVISRTLPCSIHLNDRWNNGAAFLISTLMASKLCVRESVLHIFLPHSSARRSWFDEKSRVFIFAQVLPGMGFQILILYRRIPDDALVSSILMYHVWTRQIIWSIHPNVAAEELHGQ